MPVCYRCSTTNPLLNTQVCVCKCLYAIAAPPPTHCLIHRRVCKCLCAIAECVYVPVCYRCSTFNITAKHTVCGYVGMLVWVCLFQLPPLPPTSRIPLPYTIFRIAALRLYSSAHSFHHPHASTPHAYLFTEHLAFPRTGGLARTVSRWIISWELLIHTTYTERCILRQPFDALICGTCMYGHCSHTFWYCLVLCAFVDLALCALLMWYLVLCASVDLVLCTLVDMVLCAFVENTASEYHFPHYFRKNNCTAFALARPSAHPLPLFNIPRE